MQKYHSGWHSLKTRHYPHSPAALGECNSPNDRVVGKWQIYPKLLKPKLVDYLRSAGSTDPICAAAEKLHSARPTLAQSVKSRNLLGWVKPGFLWRIRGLVAPPCPFAEKWTLSRSVHRGTRRQTRTVIGFRAAFDVLLFQKDRKHSVGFRAVLVGICVHSPSYSGKNALHRDRSEEPEKSWFQEHKSTSSARPSKKRRKS